MSIRKHQDISSYSRVMRRRLYSLLSLFERSLFKNSIYISRECFSWKLTFASISGSIFSSSLASCFFSVSLESLISVGAQFKNERTALLHIESSCYQFLAVSLNYMKSCTNHADYTSQDDTNLSRD